MLLYVVRHAVAFEHDPTQWPDDRNRPLTDAGIKKFRRAARGLRSVARRVDTLLSSPLIRAWQTAEILNHQAGWPEPARFEALEPGRSAMDVVAALQPYASSQSLAVVGHEPGLSALLAYLLGGDGSQVQVDVKKGSVACLAFDHGIVAGSGTLRWFLTPRLMRTLG